MKVSALVPVYNETDLLVRTLDRLKANLGSHLHEFLISVSPRSTNECLDLCRRLADSDPVVRTYVQSNRPGIGIAYQELIEHITGSHALIISSDLETNPDDALKLVKVAETTGADVVQASRWLPGGGFEGYDPFKLVLNYAYNLIFRVLYGISIHDITFGYKLVTTEVLRRIEWEYGRHEFCCELLLKPVRMGYKAAETSTRWIKRPEGQSKNEFFRNFKFASAAWKIRFANPATFERQPPPAQLPRP